MNSIKKIKIPNELSLLARAFPVDLFVVGGYVRNQLLGIDHGDVDLCSSLTVDKLGKIAEDCGFSIKYRNKALGTAKLEYNERVYDYATFRSETYGDDNGHRPCDIKFIDSIEDDAKRRDFSINAIYYNINKETLTDFYNGFYDIRRGIVKAVETPDFVMQSDGERILRMIRFAGEFNFKIDKMTYQAALRNVDNLKGISFDRIVNEIKRILYCDKKYPQRARKKTFVSALKTLNKMDIWSKLGLESSRVNYNMVKKTKKREFGLVIDMIDTVNPASVSYFINRILKRTSISKKRGEQIVNIISGYYDALNKKSNKQYFFKYFDNFDYIFELLMCKSKNIALKYQFFYKYIISYHLVIKTSDLKISNRDLKENFPSLPQKMYGDILTEVLSDVFDGKYENERNTILKELEAKFTLQKN